MTRFFILLMLSLSITGFAQQGPNRFDEESAQNIDNTTPQNEGNHTMDAEARDGGGNPGDPVPVDDYIPVLVLTALAIIIHTTRKKRKLLS